MSGQENNRKPSALPKAGPMRSLVESNLPRQSITSMQSDDSDDFPVPRASTRPLDQPTSSPQAPSQSTAFMASSSPHAFQVPSSQPGQPGFFGSPPAGRTQHQQRRTGSAIVYSANLSESPSRRRSSNRGVTNKELNEDKQFADLPQPNQMSVGFYNELFREKPSSSPTTDAQLTTDSSVISGFGGFLSSGPRRLFSNPQSPTSPLDPDREALIDSVSSPRSRDVPEHIDDPPTFTRGQKDQEPQDSHPKSRTLAEAMFEALNKQKRTRELSASTSASSLADKPPRKKYTSAIEIPAWDPRHQQVMARQMLAHQRMANQRQDPVSGKTYYTSRGPDRMLRHSYVQPDTEGAAGVDLEESWFGPHVDFDQDPPQQFRAQAVKSSIQKGSEETAVISGIDLESEQSSRTGDFLDDGGAGDDWDETEATAAEDPGKKKGRGKRETFEGKKKKVAALARRQSKRLSTTSTPGRVSADFSSQKVDMVPADLGLDWKNSRMDSYKVWVFGTIHRLLFPAIIRHSNRLDLVQARLVLVSEIESAIAALYRWSEYPYVRDRWRSGFRKGMRRTDFRLSPCTRQEGHISTCAGCMERREVVCAIVFFGRESRRLKGDVEIVVEDEWDDRVYDVAHGRAKPAKESHHYNLGDCCVEKIKLHHRLKNFESKMYDSLTDYLSGTYLQDGQSSFSRNRQSVDASFTWVAEIFSGYMADPDCPIASDFRLLNAYLSQATDMSDDEKRVHEARLASGYVVPDPDEDNYESDSNSDTS